MAVENCLFCKIAEGQIPSKIVYQDEDVGAFEDINPQAPHHILLIPRRHITSISDLTLDDAPTLALLFIAANKLAQQLGLRERGSRPVAKGGPRAGQAVPPLPL